MLKLKITGEKYEIERFITIIKFLELQTNTKIVLDKNAKFEDDIFDKISVYVNADFTHKLIDCKSENKEICEAKYKNDDEEFEQCFTCQDLKVNNNFNYNMFI